MAALIFSGHAICCFTCVDGDLVCSGSTCPTISDSLGKRLSSSHKAFIPKAIGP